MDKEKHRIQKPESRSQNRKIKNKTASPVFWVLCALLCLLVSGCALPRIVILDDPLTPEEHINLGVAYEKKGEFNPAVEEYQKASERLPAAYLYLGNAYMQMNRLEEAEAAYKKSIKKSPETADAYNNLAWLYYVKRDNLDEAESLVLKALQIDPSRGDYRDTLDKIRELKSGNGL